VAGSGSGIDVAGSGSGIDVAGSGSGIDVAGSGSGLDVAGSGSGSQILVAGSGSGTDAITITLPEGTGMAMEISMGCKFATVAVIDSNSVQVVAFNKVRLIGSPEFCNKRFGNGRN
jgi:hypothetical protein